ncbi:DUF11 domain-containing protein [Candidatus Microgenomates bacterium]|nr:DUF11 domain-containing protein [Candidatus Microgenomates bacterium]
MIRQIVLLLVLGGFFAFLPVTILASGRCETQYGGGQTCVAAGQILVNKKVWDPINKVFVDNLLSSVKVFQAGEEVIFSIEVKNVGDDNLHNVHFTDSLPSFLVWSGGDPLNFTIGDMAPTASVTRTIKAKVVVQPGNRCGNNNVTASSNEGSDSDSAQVCVSQPPKEVPKAGPEMGILALLPSLGAIGYYLRKMRGVNK